MSSSAATADPSLEQLIGDGVPDNYRAAYVHKEDAVRLAGQTGNDVRETLRVGEVPMPELAPDEVVVAVMAAGMNYNTIWSARFEPIPGFVFLEGLARTGGWNARHAADHHVLGSDAAGVVARVGSGVRGWSPGAPVVISPSWFDSDEAAGRHDQLTARHALAWGFETNFGGLADYAVVKASQLMPKARHLSWEEAACNTLCAATAYRMLVSEHGAPFKQGDIVFIWGAAGGLGSYAVQLVRNGGGIAVGVVNSERKQRLLEALGCDLVIRRDEMDLAGPDPIGIGKAFGKRVRNAFGEDPHIVFEHVGASTFGASVYMLRKGGKVVTCGSSTGYQHEFDNRHLWMKTKSIVGSHGSTLQEARECNRLFELGRLQPALSSVYPLADVATAAGEIQHNRHLGKVGVLCLAPEEGLGVEDPERRSAVGEERIRLFRTAGG